MSRIKTRSLTPFGVEVELNVRSPLSDQFDASLAYHFSRAEAG